MHSTGGERWYVNNVELTYSTSNSLFEHIDRPNLNVKLSTPPHTFLFPTPIGKSFECMTEQTIVMFAQVIQSTKLLLNHFCLIKYFRRRKLIKNTFMSRKFFYIKSSLIFFRTKTTNQVIQRSYICAKHACKVLCIVQVVNGVSENCTY